MEDYITERTQVNHFEDLLNNMIDYLWEIWNNEDVDYIEKSFKKLGFTDNDLEYFGIKEELLYIKECNKESESDK